jgi:integrase/recombinase XerD
MNLQKAVEGFTIYLKASSYSPSTVELYNIVLNNLGNFLNNPEVDKISYQDLQRYMIYLQEEYVPKRFGNKEHPLSGSSRQNHWKAIRTFFKWASEYLHLKKRPDERLKLPINNPKAVLPLSEQDIRALLKSAEFTKEAHPENRGAFKMRRRTATRDIALMLLMLDTGLRVGEVSRLNVQDVDFETGEVFVAPFGNSMMKTKSRVVYLGKNSKNSLWHYLSTRKDFEKTEPLFLSERKKRLDGNAVRCLLSDLGDRASVSDVHPHRFRHTFAIQFLRGGGDVFSLQRILGHSSLQMVSHYLALANCDTANAHRRASPVDKLTK